MEDSIESEEQYHQSPPSNSYTPSSPSSHTEQAEPSNKPEQEHNQETTTIEDLNIQQECLDRFSSTDFIMEPTIFDTIKKYYYVFTRQTFKHQK